MSKIALFIGPMAYNRKWDETNLEKGAIGGSEIWAIELAREFSNRGNEVYLYGDTANEHQSKSGVYYKRWENFVPDCTSIVFDNIILSRRIDALNVDLNCKNIFLMCHDVIIIDGKEDKNGDRRLDKVKKVFYQSEYQKNALKKKYNIPEDQFAKTIEGIDMSRYENIDDSKKVNKMLCSSGKGRGTEWLIKEVFPLIRAAVPDFEIHLCSYYDNYDEEAFHQDGIKILGNLDKDDLIREQKESKIWIYPNHGYNSKGEENAETFSITTIENAMAHCACILSNWGCFGTTLKGYNGFVGNDLFEDMFTMLDKSKMDEFAKLLAEDAIKCLTDEEYRMNKVRSGAAIASQYTWANAADSFENEWKEKNESDIDVQVYVLTQKDAPYMIKDEWHTPLQVGKALTDEKIFDLTDDTGDNISAKNHVYSESTGVYWIWKNALKNKYIGHEQYRRHFNMTKTDIERILNTYDIIVPTPLELKLNIEEHYKMFHNLCDLKACEDIINEYYPEYAKDYSKYIKNGKTLYYSDSYITTKENYVDINEFIFDILGKVEDKLNLHSEADWEKHVEDCGQTSCPADHEKDGLGWKRYQMLAGGFLYERLFTLYILHNFKHIYERKFQLLEQEWKIKNMKTLVCCIGRQENDYIREFVDYYKLLGASNICLYDNNYDGEDNYYTVIGDYIDEGYVILKDYRNREKCQLDAYNECYQEYGDKYDWILFFDIDEFMFINSDKKLHEYLVRREFDRYDMIHINWLLFGDGDMARSDGRRILERIPQPLDINATTTYDFPDNFHVKSIVRGGLKNVKWTVNSHTPSIEGECCNASGSECDKNSPFTPYDFRYAGLRHFTTKTAEEYAFKMKRGFPDGNSITAQKMAELFFKRNKLTEEKVEIFKDIAGVDVSYLLPVKFTGTKSKDVKIFSLCYEQKNFPFINNSIITPLQVGAAANGNDVCEVKDNTGDNISGANYFYIEGTGTYWIWKNIHGCKYKGQMQYRRPLSGITEDTNFSEIFQNYDVITCEPFYHPDHKTPTEKEPMVIPADTVEEGYAFSNCVDDLYILELAIKTYFPEYKEDWDKYIKKGGNLYYSNGFILKEADYDRYSTFLFQCLNAYLQLAGIRNQQDLLEHVRYNLEVGKYPRYDKEHPCTEGAFKWQTEIGGFLSERVWTLWLLHNFKEERIYKTPYIKMEDNMYT